MSRPSATQLVCPHLIRLDGDQPTLVGCRCSRCGEIFFPVCAACTRCLSTELEPCDIGSRGSLWSWTIQAFLPKAPYDGGETEADFKPYGVGYVQMPGGIKIEGRLTVADPALLRIGMPMKLTLTPYRRGGDDGASTFAFAPG